MPSLQIRDLPDAIYRALSLKARRKRARHRFAELAPASPYNRGWDWVLSVVVCGVDWGEIEDAELELGDPRDRPPGTPAEKPISSVPRTSLLHCESSRKGARHRFEELIAG